MVSKSCVWRRIRLRWGMLYSIKGASIVSIRESPERLDRYSDVQCCLQKGAWFKTYNTKV